MALTAEQLEVRKGKVMASDVAAIVGMHPYVKPFQAWARNLGLEEVDYTDAMRMGDVLETPLVWEAARRLGWESVNSRGTVFHPAFPWAGCTPDAMRASLLPEGMQVKVSGLHMARDYKALPGESETGNDADSIPVYHLLQCQWEMFVMQAPLWHLVVYFGGADLRIYRLEYNRSLVDAMRESAHAFWSRHLDPAGEQAQPPLDGSKAAAEFLKRSFPRNKESRLLTPGDHHYDLAIRYQEAKAKAKEYEAAADEAKHQLCQDIGDADGIEGICTWKAPSPKPKVDWEKTAMAIWQTYEPLAGGSPYPLSKFAADFTTQPDGVRQFRLTHKE